MKSRSKFRTTSSLESLVIALAIIWSGRPTALADTSAVAARHKLPYPQYVHVQVERILDTLVQSKDYPAATESLQKLFDQVILYLPPDRPDALREVDFARRLVTQLKDVKPDTREALLPYLRLHESLAQTLVFLIRQDRQSSAGIYKMLDTLREKRGDKLDQYATLAAAICVVHNAQYTIHVNENHATSVDPVDIFDYYVKNEGRMFFGIKNVPAELLVFVVDTTATIPEMQWALSKYAGNTEVGKLFFSIKYDYTYLKSGKDKQLTEKGFNLQNIAAYGGVCIDQAYFATTVGKAIGIPSTMDEGMSGEAGHAWAGFLQFGNNRAWWNFDNGRYQSYQGVQGSVMDPQTRQNLPDSYVSLLGEMIGTKTIDRQNTVALTDAAHQLGELEKSSADVAPPLAEEITSSTISAKPRARDTQAQLNLIDSALRQSVAYTPAWFTVRDLAIAKKLTLADKKRWSDLLLRLGAKKYPDFTLAVLMPMVQTIDEPREQDSLLANMLPLFASRKDLSASIQMAQASLWEAQKQNERACQCYLEVVQHYSNDGPFVLSALSRAEKLMVNNNRPDAVPLLYAQAWSLTKKPGNMAPEFVAESNWFRIGKLYALKLKAAGDSNKAADVETTLSAAPKGA